MKKIAILLRPDHSLTGYDIYLGYKVLFDIILELGCVPVPIIPPVTDNFYGKDIDSSEKLTSEQTKILYESLTLCDGLLLQGGDNFYDYDLKAIDYFYRLDKPILGICLGMQTMAYFLGGEIKEIGNTSHKKLYDYVHNVIIKKDSLIYNIFKENEIMVNSRHNFYVTVDQKYISGVSSDNIVEAIEDSSKKFFLGVQWHPENMIDYDSNMIKIFEKFVEAAKKSS